MTFASLDTPVGAIWFLVVLGGVAVLAALTQRRWVFVAGAIGALLQVLVAPEPRINGGGPEYWVAEAASHTIVCATFGAVLAVGLTAFFRAALHLTRLTDESLQANPTQSSDSPP